MIYYGQNREDITLSAFFTDIKVGFYVDVGACDPIKFSITKLFYKRGWSGINIEPQEREYKRLVEDRKRDINLNVGVADKPGHLKLRAYDNESLSTFSEDIKKRYKETKEQIGLGYKDKTIETRTLKDIFAEYQVKSIQFLKVDVEGFEYEVLKGNDWKLYRPEVLCIESNNMTKPESWQALLEKVGYIKVFFDGLNEYYVAQEVSYKIKDFQETYTQLIVSTPVLSWDWEITMNKIVNQLERVQTSLNNHVALNESLKAQLDVVNNQTSNPYYLLKNLVKLTVKKR